MLSLRGHFLLASPSLRDPNFLRSVILITRHDEDGAVGVTINNPLDATVAEVLGDDVEQAVDEPLRRGGPCDGPMMVLHDLAELDASDEVTSGIFYTHTRADIEHVMAQETVQAVYVIGYAGWQADQLEREMAEGSWVTLPASPSDVFGATGDLWQRLSSRAGLLKFLPPEKIPEDPGLN
jgi:putative transcriptional regulator